MVEVKTVNALEEISIYLRLLSKAKDAFDYPIFYHVTVFVKIVIDFDMI